MSLATIAADPAVQLTLRVALAGLCLTAGLHKARDLAAFRGVLAGYRILPASAVPAAAVAVVGLELSIAVALLLPGPSPAAGPAAGALFVAYAAAIAVNLRRGRRHVECGCSGASLRQPLSPPLVARNLVLAGAALLCALSTSGRPLGWLDAVSVLAAAATFAALYAAANRLLANAVALAPLRTPRSASRGR